MRGLEITKVQFLPGSNRKQSLFKAIPSEGLKLPRYIPDFLF